MVDIRIDFTNPARYVTVDCTWGGEKLSWGVYFLGERIADLPDYDTVGGPTDDQIREEYGEKVAEILAEIIRERLAGGR